MTRLQAIVSLLSCLAMLAPAGRAVGAEGKPGAPMSLPPVERLALPNGLEILLVPSMANPYLDVRLLFRAGSALDPAGKEGLASLAAEMLTNGTETRSEHDIAETVEDVGARLRARADFDSFELTGSVITLEPEYVARFLEVFADVALHATFPEEVLTRTRLLRKASIERLADDHGALARLAFYAAVYPDQARGRPSQGYLSTVTKIGRDDLVAFRDRVLVPGHAVLAIGGAFDRVRLLAWARKAFGSEDWGAGVCEKGRIEGQCARFCLEGDCIENPLDVPTRQAKRPPAEGRVRKVLLVDREDPSINQIQWRLGGPTPYTMREPDWWPFRVGAHILGGDFTSKLNQRLREKEGLTYGAYLAVDHDPLMPGPMRVTTYVAPQDLQRSIELAIEEIRTVTDETLDPEEVRGFQTKIVNSFPFRFETIIDTVSQFLYLAARGLSPEWLASYRERIAAPTAEDIHRVFGRIGPDMPDMMTLVAVGNRDLIPILSRFGRVAVVKSDDLLATGLKQLTYPTPSE